MFFAPFRSAFCLWPHERQQNSLWLFAVASVGEAAGGTPLARVPRVYADHSCADCFRLVFQEAAQLSERPSMESALGVTARGFDAGSDVREVFNSNGRTWLDVRQDRPRESMVAIPSEAKTSPREVLQVPFGTLRPIGLQLATEAEAALLHFAPPFLAVKTVVRGHGGAAHSEVNPKRLARCPETPRQDSERRCEDATCLFGRRGQQ